MEEQFGLSDLRHLITRSTTGPVQAQLQPYLPTQPQPPDFFSSHHHQLHHHHPSFDHHMLVMGRHVTTNTTTDHHHHHHMLHQQGGMSLSRDPNTTNNATTSTVAFTTSGGFEGGAARWPRQETLTLLEIRSRLDHKFKEANQKGPLWDEVARIMLEEHGYQRSGKKCREKFENLYKYYKKTKEGKAGRQDGKHYRFFRQLEALYGDHLSPSSSHHHYIDGNTPHFHPNTTTATTITNTDGDGTCGGGASVSLSSDFATSSEDDDEDVLSEGKKKRKGKQKSWKAKIRDFIDIQMRKIMEKQEAWLDKMMRAIEKRELERREREEVWKKQEMDRIEREHKFWASERAWIEARDSALLKALNKLTSGDHHLTCGGDHWAEPEITKIIQLRTAMESRFEQCGFSEEVLWEDISAKMAYFGYERSATICKDKWDSINKELQDKGNVVKKRKDNKNKISSNNDSNNYGVISNSNHHNGGGLYINNHVISGLNHGNNCEINEPRLQLNDGSSSSPSSHNSNINVNATNVMNDSCLRFFLGDGDNNLGWETNYGVKTQHG